MPVRILSTALLALALVAPAHAAGSVPRGFFGATYDGELRDAPADVQDDAWGRMAGSGVEAARTVFSWRRAQPTEGAPFDFSLTDPYVADAAEHGVDLLPVVMDTPMWARENPGDWWPERGRGFGAYVRAVVERYGRGGTFWAANPDLPERPLRHWQIFNEPGLSRRYAPVLRAANRAAKGADQRAKIVLAGLTATPRGTAWDVLRFQYRKGRIRRWFDVAALHMYTGKADNVLEGARRFRRVMRRHRDGRKPLWLTEFGVTASKGRTEAPRSQRTLRTTDRGMARFVRRAYRRLSGAGQRRRVGVGRAYWYTWASSYERGASIFRFAGLNRFADGELRPRRALRAYRRAARR